MPRNVIGIAKSRLSERSGPRGFGLFVCAAAMALFVLGAGVTAVSTPSFAVQPDEILDDPKLESRARKISLELRCLVCQNQSIDDSDAPLARDLRLLVRERLEKGDTNEEVIDFVVSKYGEFVLLKPPFGIHTLLLWLTPLLALAGGIYLARSVLRSSRPRGDGKTDEPAATPLSEEEEERLRQLLDTKA